MTAHLPKVTESLCGLQKVLLTKNQQVHHANLQYNVHFSIEHYDKLITFPLSLDINQPGGNDKMLLDECQEKFSIIHTTTTAIQGMNKYMSATNEAMRKILGLDSAGELK